MLPVVVHVVAGLTDWATGHTEKYSLRLDNMVQIISKSILQHLFHRWRERARTRAHVSASKRKRKKKQQGRTFIFLENS